MESRLVNRVKKGTIMNYSEQSNEWIKYTVPGYYRSISFESSLGQRILNDLAKQYPSFNPKYLQQHDFSDDLSS